MNNEKRIARRGHWHVKSKFIVLINLGRTGTFLCREQVEYPVIFYAGTR